MGVGGNFWDILKPYTNRKDLDFLRNKRVAVDLSYWIVQHQTAIQNDTVRKPHLRLTFFRTINLFSKFGTFPVFVVDGIPSPLKSKARIARFYRGSGVDTSSLTLLRQEGDSVDRNHAFRKCVKECTELLELLGIPVLKARGDAEALCAQLNYEGHVDACITADSDAFLYGAKCIIKSLHPNSKEPIECYQMSDLEAGLGLKRKHMIAISLLVGNDHDLNGVHGVGTHTALRFVQSYDEDEVLNRLSEIGRGDIDSEYKFCPSLCDTSKTNYPHCSFCGHPGNKLTHDKAACEHCGTNVSKGCIKKPVGFKCACSTCDMDRKEKELKREENWRMKVSKRIAMEHNFPNDEIIKMYLSNNHGYFSDNDGPCISWTSPNVDMVVDFLAYHQHWEPSYIRQRILPMLSTIYLREKASSPTESLLHGQYEFDSIQRIKVRFEHEYYLVRWKKDVRTMGSSSFPIFVEDFDDIDQKNAVEVTEPIGLCDELDEPEILVDPVGCFLLTDENMDLVLAAFPEEVNRFLQEKGTMHHMSVIKNSEELKGSRRKKRLGTGSEDIHVKSGSSKPKEVQLSLTEFYRSTKVSFQEKPGEDLTEISDKQFSKASKGKRKVSNENLPKSVRRRLLFD